MTPPVVRGILAEASAVTQTIGASSSLLAAPWSLVLSVAALVAVGVLGWRIRRRRNRPLPVEPLGLPSLAGGPFALPAGPAHQPGASVEPVTDDVDGGRPPAWARWPFAPAATTREHERSEAIARIMVQALREIGPAPSCSATTHLAEQLALIIVSDLREDHDLGLSEGVALTASISDELSHELRRFVGPSA
jgi:hypothetical protein